MVIVLVVLASFAAAVLAASFFEWVLHKYFMHGVLVKGYPYRAHAQVHHVVFGHAATYHLSDPAHRNLVTMAWWNGPVLLLLNVPLPGLCAWLLGSAWVLAGAMAGFTAYYVAYEYLHWCMHVPAGRRLDRMRWFRWLDRHHRAHHRHPLRNLNVVLPLADLVLRSRLPERVEAPVQTAPEPVEVA